jgi:hypothetical protein
MTHVPLLNAKHCAGCTDAMSEMSTSSSTIVETVQMRQHVMVCPAAAALVQVNHIGADTFAGLLVWTNTFAGPSRWSNTHSHVNHNTRSHRAQNCITHTIACALKHTFACLHVHKNTHLYACMSHMYMCIGIPICTSAPTLACAGAQTIVHTTAMGTTAAALYAQWKV